MKVTLLDTVTGETREVAGISGFQWADNNWSCDCNRADYFGPPEDWDDGTKEGEVGGVCVGGKRFLVIAAQSEGLEQDYPHYTLADFNPDYPVELLAEHGVLVLPTITPFPTPAAAAEQAQPDDEGQEVVTLHEMYDPGLIGFKVNPGSQQVAVYSLELLIVAVQAAESVGREMAMRHIAAVMEGCCRDLGDKAPIFVDDSIRVAKQQSVIVQP